MSVVWMVSALIALWLAMAALMTAMGRNDKKSWPISWGATFTAWLVVGLPGALVVGLILFSDDHSFLGSFLLAGALTAFAWKFGQRLPVVGSWIAALQSRQEERAKKGLL